MNDTHQGKTVLKADLTSLQHYLELRHGPAIAQLLIDDLVTAAPKAA